MRHKHHTALYKAYAADGAPLYIGVSKNWARRWYQHSQVSPWILDIARIEVVWFDCRSAAFHAERTAIMVERPKWNWQYCRTHLETANAT